MDREKYGLYKVPNTICDNSYSGYEGPALGRRMYRMMAHLANTVGDPRTMMVKLLHTPVA